MKINKSQTARELGKDKRTVDKYLKGFKKSSSRERSSSIDSYYNQIKELLSDENKQIFYYKRVLWKFLTDNAGLQCLESNFRRYISKHPEFDMYFKKRKHTIITKNASMRFETEAGKQAQLDWKESMDFILKNGETITINIFVLLFILL